MRLLLAAMLLTAPVAAQAEVTDRSAAGFQIRHVLTIDAPPAKTRAAVQDIGRWWSDDHTYSGKASNLSIDAAGHLSFELTKAPDPAKTLLTLTYDVGGYAKGGLAETWAKPVDAVLGAQATRLKTYVETGKPD